MIYERANLKAILTVWKIQYYKRPEQVRFDVFVAKKDLRTSFSLASEPTAEPILE